ncbi:5'/3'-nucleotidase SurE [Picrophilus oshimae]|uniref:5'-nucleotidase SurE n=1 Tax=Picrophilus torridus (strain ATCC 700027 / DSM 9790 / JCM 10055 / NBRC 100828 / KAW 2/3) TaxID=1122961 RepID=A0A8G2FWU0_PICTO|nr:5'/3'-nucleotidase SurE [Picrophilus oshimae]SMD30888.1 5'-nucleotidase /3'-nucleotidase /exopolyphosphatase [Picrophilus oshimae DSM 9789]
MILVTNDDGYNSYGIRVLYRAASSITESYIVAPDHGRSATGMSTTYNVPLRAFKFDYGYAISGFPADSVYMARYALYNDKKIDLIVSGINHGDNISLRSLYSSGTIGATMAGALIGIKGIAFSMSYNGISNEKIDLAEPYIKAIIENAMERFPDDVDILNVNFPGNLNRNTRILPARMSYNIFDDNIIKRLDPNGHEYYWFGNKRHERCPENCDYDVVYRKNSISITPITVKGYLDDLRSTEEFISFINVKELLG